MKSCSSPLQTVPEEQNRKQQPLFRLLSGRIKFPLFLYLLIKNCDLLFCCHFRPQTTLEMAAFQQLLSATLLHPLATHRLTHFSCPRPQIWAPTSFVPRGLIKRFIVAHCTAPSWEHRKWPPSVPQQLESG